jgi:hypothetical protein
MNGALVFALATKFFGPPVILVAVANAVFWYIFLAAAKSTDLFARLAIINPKKAT